MDINLNENERIDDLEFKDLKIIQNKNGFCFGIDAVLLSDFAKDIRNNAKVLDLGTGTGILGILLCGKTNPSKIYGIELTFISTYPYGFEDNIKQTCNGKNFTIYNNSDEVGTLYPTVIITCNEAGDLSIENDMDNEIMVIKNCSAGEVITIDSKYKIIFTNDKSHDIYNDFNWNYLKVCNTYDMRFNNYISSLDITIEINYSPVRKVGMV